MTLAKGDRCEHRKTGKIVEVIAVAPPMPGDDGDVFVTVRMPDGKTRETSGRHLAALSVTTALDCTKRESVDKSATEDSVDLL